MSFNSENRSPCWTTDNTLLCLPYFYVAGMPKCGTSDIWDKLMEHPKIMRMRKEPHWWTSGRLGKLGGNQGGNAQIHLVLIGGACLMLIW